jgi:hypothetical protein
MKETWEQFQERVIGRTSEYFQKEYNKWVEDNPEAYKEEKRNQETE